MRRGWNYNNDVIVEDEIIMFWRDVPEVIDFSSILATNNFIAFRVVFECMGVEETVGGEVDDANETVLVDKLLFRDYLPADIRQIAELEGHGLGNGVPGFE
jgi:hypothetical protein